MDTIVAVRYRPWPGSRKPAKVYQKRFTTVAEARAYCKTCIRNGATGITVKTPDGEYGWTVTRGWWTK